MKTIRNIILFIGIVLFMFSCQKDVPVEIQNEESAIAVNNVQSTGEESIFVGIEKVRDIAENFNFSGEAPMTKSTEVRNVKEIVPVAGIDGSETPVLYVANYSDNKGFVVISGTKNYYPVLAESDEGSFDVNNLPPPVEFWMTMVKRSISAMNKETYV